MHLLAVATFVAGLLMVAFALLTFGNVAAPIRGAELRRLQLFNRYMVSPALVCVWLLGLTLATEADWFAAPWLQVKIVMVIILSAIHGIQSARLRRLSSSAAPIPAMARWWPVPIMIVVATIIGLATAKPALWGAG